MSLKDNRSPSETVRNRYLTNGGVAAGLAAVVLGKFAYVCSLLLEELLQAEAPPSQQTRSFAIILALARHRRGPRALAVSSSLALNSTR